MADGVGGGVKTLLIDPIVYSCWHVTRFEEQE